MAVVPVKNLGKGGLIKDTSPVNLPENVFTDALNVRFRNSSVETILGETTTFSLNSLVAEYGIHWQRPDTSYNVFVKDGTVVRRAADGTESSMLSSGAYSGSKWQIDSFGGGYAIFFNNGTSTPLYALYNGGVADSALQPFPGWNYLPGYTVTAKVIRPFNYSLVAANLTINDGVNVTNAPSTIRISVQAAIGGFPTVWQPGLTTDTADEFEVNTSSPIVDMLELRGNLMIYSSDSIHSLTINNGIASVRPYARGHGVLAAGCVAEFDNKHFVVDRNDIYIHNGSGQIQPVAEGRMRQYFLSDVNQSYIESTFVIRDARYKEIWVCYPDQNALEPKCNKALIYNYDQDTYTLRTLPKVKSMFKAPELTAGSFKYGKEVMLALQGAARVLQMDSGYQMLDPVSGNYNDFTSMIERRKLVVADDPFGSNVITGITPIFEVNDIATTVDIYVTAQNVYDKEPSYANPDGRDKFVITPRSESQGYMVNPRADGRFLNIRIESTKYWKLSFLGLDIKNTSRR
ncbi:MAG TPA: hypothetical protein P5539_05715 [Mesotoga sp.]|nr:hypothetical protein [Mesotoga sp.]